MFWSNSTPWSGKKNITFLLCTTNDIRVRPQRLITLINMWIHICLPRSTRKRTKKRAKMETDFIIALPFDFHFVIFVGENIVVLVVLFINARGLWNLQFSVLINIKTHGEVYVVNQVRKTKKEFDWSEIPCSKVFY